MQGFQPLSARRLAQPPQQPADDGLVARMKSADAGPATFGARGLSQLRDMVPKMAEMGFKQAPAPAPAPTPAPAPVADPRAAQLMAMIPRMEAMGYKQQPQQPQYLASGGLVRGPGTSTSDSIPDEAEPGTFIMPADSTAAIGPSALEKMGTVPVRLSDGEFKLPPEQVMALGTAVLKMMKDVTHTPVNGVDGGQTDAEVDGARGFAPGAADRMAQMPEQPFADGGAVGFPALQQNDAAWQALMQGNAQRSQSVTEQADIGDAEAQETAAEAQARAEESMAQAEAEDPSTVLRYADGGLVENNVTRVGNSYSGGNVGGNITVNGGATAGTFSENPAGRMAAMPTPSATPAPVTTPAPATPPAVAAMSTPPAATAAQPPAPMGWAERNAQRNAAVSAASITNRPEWSRAPAPVAAGFQPGADRLGTMPPVGQPQLGFPPRRYADGGTVEDRAVFGFYPQLTDHGKTTRATADHLRQGVQATAPAGFQPAAPAAEPSPLPAAPRMNSLTDPRSLAFAGAPAPAAAPAPADPAPSGALSRAAQLGAPAPAPLPQGPVSAQNMTAADSLARRGAAERMAEMPNAPQQVQAPTVRHSGNDWQSRNDLRNALVSASSITNNGGAWDRHKGESAESLTYRAMLGTDQAQRAAEPAAGLAAMQEASASNRETLRARSAAAQAQASERGALDRTLIKEGGENARTGLTALATLEAARTKAGALGQKPLNDVQSKALQFGTRMQTAGQSLDKLAAAGVDQPGLIKRGADTVGLGAAANWTQSGQQQQVEQAQRDFVNAVLRRESGAAIADSEFANAKQQYFPQVGDSPEVIAQKRKNREIATSGVLAEVPESERRVGEVVAKAEANTPPAAQPAARGPVPDDVGALLKKYGG